MADGWYLDKECTNRYVFDKEVTEGFTLYAKWNRYSLDNCVKETMLTLNKENIMALDDTGNIDGETYYSYFLLVCKVTGGYKIDYGNLTFSGNKTSQSVESVTFKIYNNTTNKTILNTTTISDVNYKTVSFYANEGDLIIIQMNQSIYNRRCKARVNVTTDFTEYLDSSSVISYSNQSYSDEILFGYSYSLPSVMYKEGYNFIGWEYNGNIVNNYGTYEFLDDITFKAIYEKIE